MVLVCTEPVTWCEKFTKSVSYWKCPASTVYGTFDLVGRSVLKLRIWSVGTGFRSQYWFLSGLVTNGGSVGSDSAESHELQATNSATAAVMHEIARILPPVQSHVLPEAKAQKLG